MTTRNNCQFQSQDTEDLLSPTRDESPSSFDNDVSQFLAKLEQQKSEHAAQESRAATAAAATIPKAPPPSIVIDGSSATGGGREVEWQRRLSLRKCINMHNLAAKKSTALAATMSSTGKSAQLSVTAVAFSKDHKALHVGDSQGRVTTWLASTGTIHKRKS